MNMPEILGATLLGVIFQGFFFKVLTKRSVSKLIAIGATGVVFAVLFIAVVAIGFSGDAPIDFQKSAAIAIPGTLISSVIIFLVGWSQSAAQT